MQLHPLQLERPESPWRSLALHCPVRSSRCSLLALSSTGRFVQELRPKEGRRSSARHWRLSPRTEGSLHALSVLNPREAAQFCSQAAKDADLALLAVTQLGEVVALCSEGGLLEPTLSLAPPSSTGREYLGVWLDEARHLWLMSQRGEEGLLRAMLPSGELLGTWALPRGRLWAPGLCPLEPGSAFLIAGRGLTLEGNAVGPELWKVVPDVSQALERLLTQSRLRGGRNLEA